MDPDFADFLLDESHLELKQKQVVDEDEFLKNLKLSEDDDILAESLYEAYSDNLTAHEDFDSLPFEVTAEDLALLEAQERQVIQDQQKMQIPQHPYTSTLKKVVVAEKENAGASSNVSEMSKPQAELEYLRDRTLHLNLELSNQKRQLLTKEGEITILRQRLSQLDQEKLVAAQKFAERTEQNRREIEKIESNWRRDVDRLKTEILFKEQELKSFSRQRKVPKNSQFTAELPRDFDHIHISAAPAKDVQIPPKPLYSTSNLLPSHLRTFTDSEIFELLSRKLDLKWNFSDIDDYSTLDIVRSREEAVRAIRAIDGASGTALTRGIISLLSKSIHLRQPTLLIYTSQLIYALFDLVGDRLKEPISSAKSGNENSVEFNQMLCKILSGNVIVRGIPKEVILNIFLVVNILIFQNEMKIPKEFKSLMGTGFFQWILRKDLFDSAEFGIICSLLYSSSHDLDCLAELFLSAESDKVECLSVLDILQTRAKDLVDSLFPGGKVYRRNRNEGASVHANEEEERLKKLDALLSLLFSFVHRALGPATLWLTENILRSIAIWTVDIVEHDLETARVAEILSAKILIAQEELLGTIFSGLSACWKSPDVNMTSVLAELRGPLGFVARGVSRETSSYLGSGVVPQAAQLFKLIDREVADDLKCLYDTGLLANRCLNK